MENWSGSWKPSGWKASWKLSMIEVDSLWGVLVGVIFGGGRGALVLSIWAGTSVKSVIGGSSGRDSLLVVNCLDSFWRRSLVSRIFVEIYGRGSRGSSVPIIFFDSLWVTFAASISLFNSFSVISTSPFSFFYESKGWFRMLSISFSILVFSFLKFSFRTEMSPFSMTGIVIGTSTVYFSSFLDHFYTSSGTLFFRCSRSNYFYTKAFRPFHSASFFFRASASLIAATLAFSFSCKSTVIYLYFSSHSICVDSFS